MLFSDCGVAGICGACPVPEPHKEYLFPPRVGAQDCGSKQENGGPPDQVGNILKCLYV